MDEKVVYEVVTKLIGPTNSTGSYEEDNTRLQNLTVLTGVIGLLLTI